MSKRTNVTVALSGAVASGLGALASFAAAPHAHAAWTLSPGEAYLTMMCGGSLLTLCAAALLAVALGFLAEA